MGPARADRRGLAWTADRPSPGRDAADLRRAGAAAWPAVDPYRGARLVPAVQRGHRGDVRRRHPRVPPPPERPDPTRQPRPRPLVALRRRAGVRGTTG